MFVSEGERAYWLSRYVLTDQARWTEKRCQAPFGWTRLEIELLVLVLPKRNPFEGPYSFQYLLEPKKKKRFGDLFDPD
jgi:hypothetical protein